MLCVVAKAEKRPFDVKVFLNTVDGGRTVATYRRDQKVFSQGDPADSVFFIQKGKVKVYVVSEQGKEAVVALHGSGDFFGEGCLTGQPLRLATVSAITESVVMRLDKAAMVRVLRDEPKFSEMFMSFLLARNARVEEDLGRPALQFEREASCEIAPPNGELRQGREAGACHSEDKPRDARGDGRHHEVAASF
jgi:CRP/FNR family transcriptional regulator, cyclic AMP receptor protein